MNNRLLVQSQKWYSERFWRPLALLALRPCSGRIWQLPKTSPDPALRQGKSVHGLHRFA